MADRLIKICGIRDPKTAARTIQLGAHFVGVVFHPDSPRNVSVKEAKIISDAVRNEGGIPVAVFVNQNASEMKLICDETGIEMIQPHGEPSQREAVFLPEKIGRIHVRGKAGEVNTTRDFVLIDHPDPGKGKQLNWENLSVPQNSRWFLGGGLHAENIKQVLRVLNPHGVDVSSGVESSSGIKDIARIQQFIESVKFYDER